MTVAIIEYFLCSACLATLFMVGVPRGLTAAASMNRRHAVPAAVLLAAALAARLLCPPAFIHANFHGYSLLNAILEFPKPSEFRAEYGQGSFLALGLFARIFGGGWDSVVAANCLANTGILACAAILAGRMGGAAAAFASIALGVLWPPMVRVAASEDAHNVAVLAGMIALVAADGMRRAGRASAPGIAVTASAAMLALFSRQSMLLYPLIAWALVFPLKPWKSRGWVFPSAASLTVAAYMIMIKSMSGTPDVFTLEISARLQLSGELFRLLLRHPLFNPVAGLPFLALAVWGAVAGFRKKDFTVVVLAAAAPAIFTSSVSMSLYPGDQINYAMRMPLWGILPVLSGAGAARLAEAAKGMASERGKFAAVAAVAAGCLLWPLGPYLKLLAEKNPQAQEYRIIRDHARAVGAGTLKLPSGRSPKAPSWSAPLSAFGVARPVPEMEDGKPGPVSVYSGLNCHSFSLEDLAGRDEIVSRLFSPGITNLLWGPPEAVLDSVGAGRPPPQRPECRDFAAMGLRFEKWGDVVIERQEPLFIYYTAPVIPVGVWRRD